MRCGHLLTEARVMIFDGHGHVAVSQELLRMAMPAEPPPMQFSGELSPTHLPASRRVNREVPAKGDYCPIARVRGKRESGGSVQGTSIFEPQRLDLRRPKVVLT